MQNRLFFPQSVLDHWNVEGLVEVQAGKLTIVGAGRRYELAEAVRVLREVGGKEDALGLVGRVKTRDDLERGGAELVETSMLVGDGAYDIEPGWLGTPIGTFDAGAHGLFASQKEGSRTTSPREAGTEAAEARGPTSDEELLLGLLVKTARKP